MGISMLDCGQADRALLAQLATPSRNRYYYGKLLDSYHLALEQRYGNDKRWLLNRLTLGAGVLCGLDVVANADGSRVRVRAGVAIDGVGREIIVPEDSPPVDPRQPTDECGRADGAPIQGDESVTLYLCYLECEAEPAPVLVSECGPERTCENGLVRERYRLRIGRGEPAPPGSLTPEQCTAIFGQPPNGQSRRTVLCNLLGGTCDAPDETCVPLAVIHFDPNGGLPTIDRCAVRQTIYSNAVLLDLILCLAVRVDACCGQVPVQVRSIVAVSGDNQTGPAGQPLPLPLVAQVMDSGTPVANEPVTFTVISGGGEVGDTLATVGPTFTVNTDAGGLATLLVWTLGATPGPQQVTASIAAGAPSSVTFNARASQVAVDLPVVLTIWPPNDTVLTGHTAVVLEWVKAMQESPHIELTFNHKMNQAQLKEMPAWLRVFAAHSQGQNEIIVRRVAISYDGPAPQGGMLGTPGFPESYALRDLQPVELRDGRLIVMIHAESGNIVDTNTPAQLLDAEFRGSKLPVAQQDAIWQVTTPQVFPQSVWDALVDSGAVLPQSGDGAEGGRFDSWCAFEGIA